MKHGLAPRLRACAGLSALALALPWAGAPEARAEPPVATDPYPNRAGESGALHVPWAEVLPLGGGRVAAELRFDLLPTQVRGPGLSALAAVLGLGPVEVGFTLRQGGLPGDPRPSPILVGLAAKLRVRPERGWRPGLAVDVVGDRLNEGPTIAARLIASTERMWRLRFGAFAGGELYGFGKVAGGPVAGAAISALLPFDVEVVVEGIGGLRGFAAGAALRRAFLGRRVGVWVGSDWVSSDNGVRVVAGLAFVQAPPARPPAPAVEAVPRPVVAAPAEPRFTDERPRFRLRIPVVPEPGTVAGRRVHYPSTEPAPSTAPPQATVAPTAPRISDGLSPRAAQRVGNALRRAFARCLRIAAGGAEVEIPAGLTLVLHVERKGQLRSVTANEANLGPVLGGCVEKSGQRLRLPTYAEFYDLEVPMTEVER